MNGLQLKIWLFQCYGVQQNPAIASCEIAQRKTPHLRTIFDRPHLHFVPIKPAKQRKTPQKRKNSGRPNLPLLRGSTVFDIHSIDYICTVSFSIGLPSSNGHVDIYESSNIMEDTEDLHGLVKKIIAVESVIFARDQFALLKPLMRCTDNQLVQSYSNEVSSTF